jgi:hypothetical protein
LKSIFATGFGAKVKTRDRDIASGFGLGAMADQSKLYAFSAEAEVGFKCCIGNEIYLSVIAAA